MLNRQGDSATPSMIGVDIGGTFTDIVVSTPGDELLRCKVLSTPPNFSEGVVTGLTKLNRDHGVDLADAVWIVHATTVATNAIIEGTGARTALVTTRGFRDVLEIARSRRPSLYDLRWRKPEPLAPRQMRFELDHRIAPNGEVERPFDSAALDELTAAMAEHDVEALAVCLINSYARPDEEREVARQLARRLPGVAVTASVDLVTEVKEYERTSTAVVNAYVRPAMQRYLRDLVERLRALGAEAPLMIMHSAGGLMSADIAAEQPVQLIESGPAAGVIACRGLIRELSLENAIAFDMGGTTAKASVLERGEPFEAAEYEVGGGMNIGHGLARGSGHAIRAPSLDIAEVGAGGGSIVWIDPGGAPRVGPRSAGAAPGPACYGRGGTEPTLTDALVALGYLDTSAIAGGTQRIDAQLALEAIERGVAAPLGIGVLEAAYGAYRIAIADMSRAVRAVTSERGRDPRDFALVAFGGAGPAYAVDLAREFDMSTVIVPANGGLFSAVGLLVAETQYHAAVSHTRHDVDTATVVRAFEQMENDLRDRVRANGHGADHVALERFADVRYAGQSSELRIRVPAAGAFDMAALRQAFDDEHEQTYGHRGSDQRIELVSLRVRATCVPDGADASWRFGQSRQEASTSVTNGSREAYFGSERGTMSTPVVSRGGLSSDPIAGPLIVADMDATIVVPPGAGAARDELGNIRIEVG